MKRKHSIDFSNVEKITRDSFAPECDVNNIVNRYVQTGMVANVARGKPQFIDCPEQDFTQSAFIAAEVASQAETAPIEAKSLQEPETAPETPESEAEPQKTAPEPRDEDGA